MPTTRDPLATQSGTLRASDAVRVQHLVSLLLRAVVGLGACALVLLTALVLGAGSMEYPLASRPGLRFVTMEAAPPLIAGIAALSAWALPRMPASAAHRGAAALVLLALGARALGRIGFGAPPAAWLEITFVVVVLTGAAMLEVVRVLPAGHGEG